jgi:hypothetical protein
MDTAWLDTLERECSARPPDGPVYCRQCLYFGQPFLAPLMSGSALSDSRSFFCWHANARVVVQEWDGVHCFRMPPWVRNAQNACADFAPRTLRNRFLIYPYRTGAVVLGLAGLLVWVLKW